MFTAAHTEIGDWAVFYCSRCFFNPIVFVACLCDWAYLACALSRSRQTARLAALYAQTQIKVDWANDEHHALLRRLWQLMAPPDLGANFPGTKSEQWKLLGFQVYCVGF